MMKIRYWVALVFLLAGLGFLIFNQLPRSMAYYVTVAEFLEKKEKYADKKIKLAGIAKDIQFKDGQYSFFIHEKDQKLAVTYKGFVPDTFKEGSEVVVTGRSTNSGFIAEEILAKCASKYEEKVSFHNIDPKNRNLITLATPAF